jgi:hypothetical protein
VRGVRRGLIWRIARDNFSPAAYCGVIPTSIDNASVTLDVLGLPSGHVLRRAGLQRLTG